MVKKFVPQRPIKRTPGTRKLPPKKVPAKRRSFWYITVLLLIIFGGVFYGSGYYEFVEILVRINAARLHYGYPVLLPSGALTRAAKQHAQDMADNNYFSHTSLGSKKQSHQRIIDAGYLGNTYGENIAAGQNTPQQVVTTWMNSPPHRANILNPNYTHIGIGTKSNTHSQYKTYWVATFGGR